MTCSIYVLCDPDTEEIRYVGQTTKTLTTRLSQHICDAERISRSHLHKWIRKMLDNNKRPSIFRVQENAEWNEDETRWIKQLRDNGYNLVNATQGGEGTLGFCPSIETRYKKSIAMMGNKHLLGHFPSIETRNKISNSLKDRKVNVGRKLSEEHKMAVSRANKGKKLSQEHKNKIGAAGIGRKHSPESILKMSMIATERWRKKNGNR